MKTWTKPDIPVLQPDEMLEWRAGGPWGAVARLTNPSSESYIPDLLFTPDGEEWVRGQFPRDVVDAAQMGLGNDTYAVGQAGVMVAALVDDSESVVLLSQDLQQWQTVDHPLPTSGEMGLEVTGSPAGAYLLSTPAGGADGPVPIVGYVSTDGQSWEAMTSSEEYQIASGGAGWSTGWRDGFAVYTYLFPEGSDQLNEGPGESQIWLSTDDGTLDEVDMSAVPVSHMVPELQGSTLGLLTLGQGMPKEGEESEGEDTDLVFSSDGQDLAGHQRPGHVRGSRPHAGRPGRDQGPRRGRGSEWVPTLAGHADRAVAPPDCTRLHQAEGVRPAEVSTHVCIRICDRPASIR